jgi:hypothetical protein
MAAAAPSMLDGLAATAATAATAAAKSSSGRVVRDHVVLDVTDEERRVVA